MSSFLDYESDIAGIKILSFVRKWDDSSATFKYFSYIWSKNFGFDDDLVDKYWSFLK